MPDLNHDAVNEILARATALGFDLLLMDTHEAVDDAPTVLLKFVQVKESSPKPSLVKVLPTLDE